MPKAFRLPLLWLAVVLCLGSGWFGAAQTGAWVIPALGTLVPWASARDLHALHNLLRKLWHLTQYAILARAWLHGILAWRPATTVRSAAWAALLVSIACAFVDEAHQSMLLTRTGSVGDAVLDSLGALLMLMLLRARYEPAAADTVTATAD